MKTTPIPPLHISTPRPKKLNDGLGRLIKMDRLAKLTDEGLPAENTANWSTKFQYDVNDQNTHVTDAQNNVRIRRFDGLKRLTFENDPNRGIKQLIYDEASNLVETIDANQQRITYTYDGLNRKISEDYHDDQGLTPDVEYFFDQYSEEVPVDITRSLNSKNTLGQLAFVRDLSGEEYFSYDERGRIAWNIKRIRHPIENGLTSYLVSARKLPSPNE